MLLIVRYDCYVAGKLTDLIDYQVRSYNLPEDTDLEAFLKVEPTHTYFNGENEVVEWRYGEIMAAEWKPNFEHGSEAIGFITGKSIPEEVER